MKTINDNKMMRLRQPLSGLKLAATGMLMLAMFAACKKDSTPYVRPPAAGLMAYNLASDKNAVGFSLSGNTLGNSALGYAAYTGVYLPVYTGTREVRSFDYQNGSTLATASQEFKDSSYYSVFLVGYNGSYRNVLVNEHFENVTPAAGKAWVRYVNAIADSTAALSVTVGGDESAQAPYASVSAFKQVNAGAQSVSVSNGSTINASRSITLNENKIYTVLLIGQPGQTDTTKAVSIRFIENGSASE